MIIIKFALSFFWVIALDYVELCWVVLDFVEICYVVPVFYFKNILIVDIVFLVYLQFIA